MFLFLPRYDPGATHSRFASPPRATYTVLGLLGSMAMSVMKRFGRPCIDAKCQPSDVIGFGGRVPPTLVTSPVWNPALQWFSRSHGPQNPTYALLPWRASPDTSALPFPPEDMSNTFAQQS